MYVDHVVNNKKKLISYMNIVGDRNQSTHLISKNPV